MSLKRKRTMADIFQSRQITFVVGKEQKEYSIHESALSRLSRPLEALLTGGMKESQRAEVIWEDVDSSVFLALVDFGYNDSYVAPSLRKAPQPTPSFREDPDPEPDNGTFASIFSWMSKPVHRNLAKYTFCKDKFNQGKQLDTKKASPGTWATDMTKTDRTGYTDVFMFHARVYVLADTYAIQELQEFCLRRIRISLLYVTPNPELLEAFHDLILYVLENTKASDGFRKLLLHFCIAHIDWIKSSGFLQEMREELPDFLADLTVEIPLNLWSCMSKAGSHG